MTYIHQSEWRCIGCRQTADQPHLKGCKFEGYTIRRPA